MEVLNITVFGKIIDFSKSKKGHANKIDLLTGPNGSGKTRTLSALAEKLSGRDSYRKYGNLTPDDLHITLKGDLLPKKLLRKHIVHSHASRHKFQTTPILGGHLQACTLKESAGPDTTVALVCFGRIRP